MSKKLERRLYELEIKERESRLLIKELEVKTVETLSNFEIEIIKTLENILEQYKQATLESISEYIKK